MILIPQDAVQRLKGDKTDVTALDKEMTNILKNNKLSDTEKWKLYNQTLQRYLHVTDQHRKTIEIAMTTAEDPTLLQDALKSTVPKKYQSKAMQLYVILRRSKDISWSQNGEVTIKGTKIPHSHIVELINDVLRHRKNIEPTGWKDFSILLKDLNVGSEIVGNTQRYQQGSGIVWHSYKFKK